jgi:phosphogluconate dehydratase
VPAAIHLSPEALGGGPIGKVRDGDIIRLDAEAGVLQALVDPDEWAAREQAVAPPAPHGTGRELFAMMRHADEAELGASAMLAEAGL